MLWAVALNFLFYGTSFAAFGFSFGGDGTGKSGLDFNKAYDVNTVTTISGRVVSLPRIVEQEHTTVEVNTGRETITLTLGPKSFWENQKIPLRLNDQISAKGSKAQGKDGKTYLITQKLTNQTNGSQLVLRNDKGASAWSGWGAGGGMSDRPGGGMGMGNGGGGMMRGGGGMMRH